MHGTWNAQYTYKFSSPRCMTTQQSIKTLDEEGEETPSPSRLPMFITERVGPNKTNICMGPHKEEMGKESVEEEESVGKA
eukprot:15306056-Ditylum_brightwellii.AAC.1